MNSYVRAVGTAALQGLLTGVWVAAGELTPARRRLSRAGAVLAVAGAGAIKDRVFPAESQAPAVTAGPASAGGSASVAGSASADSSASAGGSASGDEGEDPQPISKARLLAGGAAVAVSIATMVGGRRLEKRWLAALQRSGHPHPHRALAVRLGLISFATAAPRGLIRAYDAGRRR